MSRKIHVAVVALVGAIGAGKTTMLSFAKCDPTRMITRIAELEQFAWLRDWPADTELVLVPEAPERWQTKNGESLLTLMQFEPKRYGAEFQTAVLSDRVASASAAIIEAIKSLPESKTHILVVTEGSMQVDRGVYAVNCVDKGFITDEQFRQYAELYGSLSISWTRDIETAAASFGCDVSVMSKGTLFLIVPIATTLAQIVQRGRECELALPIAYFQNILKRHYNLFAQQPQCGVVAYINNTFLDERFISQ